MKVRLLDVNVLVSLLDGAHVHHAVSAAWFRSQALRSGWATCPLTENVFIRVVTNPAYPNLRLTPAMAADSLARLKSAFPAFHHFWSDEVSLTDTRLFDLGQLLGSKQMTDVYLAGLAHHKSGCLATIDGKILWRAVCGATSALVEVI